MTNNLITKIWGEEAWFFNHCITFGFPDNPTEEDKMHYYIYFKNLGYVLPCHDICGKAYNEIISNGELKLKWEIFESKQSLTSWFYKIHLDVNKRKGFNYLFTYEDLVNKYESFYAKNNSKYLNRTIAYNIKNNKEIQIIPVDIAEQLLKQHNKQSSSFILLVKKYGFDEVKKLSSWKARNIFCQRKIKYMKLNNIRTKDVRLSEHELQLISYLCSNLSIKKLKKLLIINNDKSEEFRV